MKQYIGTKMIQAEPATREEFAAVKRNAADQPGTLKKPIDPMEDGYMVIYPDGYISWSPKTVFEKAYRPTSGMNFGLAIEAMKAGKSVARSGWNGKNQHIELATAISYKNLGGVVVNVEHDAIGNQAIAFCGTSGVQMGWLASQADMLADDWEITGGSVSNG